MTHSFLVLKDLKNFKTENKELAQLVLKKGDQLLMSETSALELEIGLLVEAGYLKIESEEESLKHYKEIN